jgi:hypothetical protein
MTDFVPAGDPEAMRMAARALVGQADGVRLAPEGAVAGLEALVLEGPAAARLRMAAGEVRQQAQQAAADLEAVAAALQAEAARVEQMNEERRLVAARDTQQPGAGGQPGAAQAARPDVATAPPPQPPVPPGAGEPAAPAAAAPPS